MWVSDSAKAIFLCIPKTASRSVSIWMAKNYAAEMRGEPIGTDGLRHHGICRTAKCYAFYKKYTPFATIRNPFARIVSRWYHWVIHAKQPEALMEYSQDVLEKHLLPSFYNYVENLSENEVSPQRIKYTSRKYLTPQYLWLKDAKQYFHKPILILKQENLLEDLAKLPFVKKNTQIVLPNIGHQKNYYGDWRSYYTNADIRNKIYEFYKCDFEKFEYPNLFEMSENLV